MKIPDWLKIERSPLPDAWIRTKVRWWMPSYWAAIWDALTNKQYRRHRSIRGRGGIRGWYAQMLEDVINANIGTIEKMVRVSNE